MNQEQPSADHELTEAESWIRFSLEPEVLLFRSLIDSVTQLDKRKAIYKAATLMLLAHDRLRSEQRQRVFTRVDTTLQNKTCISLNSSEESLMTWLRQACRACDPSATEWVERFINRVPEIMLMTLVDSASQRRIPIGKRIWQVASDLSQKWDPQLGAELNERLTPRADAEFTPNLSEHTLHYTLLFLEAYLDGIFPGQTPRLAAHSVRLRTNCWSKLFSISVNHG